MPLTGNSPRAKLQKKIFAMRARLKKMETLFESLEDDEIAAALAEIFGISEEEEPGPRVGPVECGIPIPPRPPTIFDDIQSALTDAGEPLTAAQIAESSGRPVESVKQVIYKQKSDRFVRSGTRTDRRFTLKN